MLNKGWICMCLYIDGSYEWWIIRDCPAYRGNIKRITQQKYADKTETYPG